MTRFASMLLAAGFVAGALVLPRVSAQSNAGPTTASTVSSLTLPLSAQGATLALRGPRGFRAALTLPANDALPGTTVTLRLSRLPLVSSQSLGAVNALLAALRTSRTPLAWFEVTTSATIHFEPGVVEFRLDLPPQQSGDEFVYASVACDESACRAVQTDLPGVNGLIVAGNRHVPMRFRFTAFGGHPYLAAIFTHALSK